MKTKYYFFILILLMLVAAAAFFIFQKFQTRVEEPLFSDNAETVDPRQFVAPTESVSQTQTENMDGNCPESETPIVLPNSPGFLFVVTQKKESGLEGETCVGQAAHVYENNSANPLAEFSPLAKPSPDFEFILDIAGKVSNCGPIPNGKIAIYDLRAKKFLFQEDLSQTLSSNQTALAQILKAQKIDHIKTDYSPHESVSLAVESAAHKKFLVTIQAITEGSNDPTAGKGTVTTAVIRLKCAGSNTTCRPELVSSTAEHKSLAYETCD